MFRRKRIGGPIERFEEGMICNVLGDVGLRVWMLGGCCTCDVNDSGQSVSPEEEGDLAAFLSQTRHCAWHPKTLCRSTFASPPSSRRLSDSFYALSSYRPCRPPGKSSCACRGNVAHTLPLMFGRLQRQVPQPANPWHSSAVIIVCTLHRRNTMRLGGATFRV